jgi:ATP-dependent DNA helicase RecQ
MSTAELSQAEKVLRDVWGYDAFRPLQEKSIRCVLDRRDSLTVLPTGGGKSICFQAPALCVDGMAVVVSPLISLMKDQVDALHACGVSAAFVNSSQSNDEKRIVAEQMRAGTLKLLYVAPERLLTDRMLDFLRQTKLSFFAIDEAHCISNWGHDFRPEYRGLRVLKEHFPETSIHAYTATASEPVRDDIVAQLGLNHAAMLVGDFDRPNLVYRMMRANNRMQQVVEIVGRHKGESCIVYCISRKEVERTSEVLRQMGCTALPYHAGLDDAQRKANQDAFIKEQCDVIVATVAFGMGIDKSNVRCVIHAGMPKSIEHYQQESGRAGRDGLESECVLLYSGADFMTWKKIMESDNQAAYEGAVKSLNAMNNLCSSAVCRHRAIVEYFGQQYTHPACDACDVCLDELELVEDPLTIGQKILSCVVRLEERFGAMHTAKVLVGADELRIRELKHNNLSTYGLMATEGLAAVRIWIDQLVSQGFLQRTGEYQVLSLTESGRRLLRRDGNPRLTVAVQPVAKKRGASGVEPSWEGVDRGLFDGLRKLRSELALERGVPAYVIFGDEPLRDFARYRPTTVAKFATIRGVGEQKKQDFANTFIAAIRDYCAQHQVSTDLDTTHKPVTVEPAVIVPKVNSFAAFEYFRRGDSLEDIAKKLDRAYSTICSYLEDYLRHENITDCTPWVDKETRDQVIAQAHLVENRRVKPLFEHFKAKISYETLRIIMICHENASRS